ncbi:hypothetical protein [Eisenbergiella porci]|uniref:hypothetical protein n=1 Tax=Eisenbergiella porci TaxID=2652274 RepID=UPI002A7F045D|nr:hypothetical protein [Eisenbergiella porci]
MGKIEGIRIQNYGPLKDITLGKTLSHPNTKALGNLVSVIGASGNGKSTFADAFGFIADCLEIGAEAACDANNRGGYDHKEAIIRFLLNCVIGNPVMSDPLSMSWL